MANTLRTTHLKFFTDFEEQASVEETDELTIPEDLSGFSREELSTMLTGATGAFETLYGEGTGLSDDDLEQLSALVDGIEAVQSAIADIDAEDAERASKAAELAARLPRAEAAPDSEIEGDLDGSKVQDSEEFASDTAAVGEEVSKPVRREVRFTTKANAQALGNRNRSQTPKRGSLVAAMSGQDISSGEVIDFEQAGRLLERKLTSFNVAPFAAAAKAGKPMTSRTPLFTVIPPRDEATMVSSNDSREALEAAISAARSRAHTSQGREELLAAGWCAPSQPLYGLDLELETTEGIIANPSIGVTRGGIHRTLGLDWRDLFANSTFGWNVSEANAIAGKWAIDKGSPAVGDKPCVSIGCPSFEDLRLKVDGLCVQGDLMQARGYPEYIARELRGYIVAHAHKMGGIKVGEMVAGSDAVTMPAGLAGSVAPLLDAIDLQASHFRYVNRMSANAVLEAVFPMWVFGALRSDLSRRAGVDLISVPDARILGWFRERRIAPQFIYNWQDLTGDADDFTAWPSSVQFLLYAAGTWLEASEDVLTVENLHDSTLLAQNKYTALWTEEGYLVAKMGHDSRLVTASLCPSGATNNGTGIGCDRKVAVAAPVEVGPITVSTTFDDPVTVVPGEGWDAALGTGI